MEMNIDNLDLDKCSWNELISFFHKSYNFYLIYRLKDLGITAGQIRFILFLKMNENSSQDDLANYLSLSKGTTAKNLRKLDDNEIIAREVNPDNRRKHNVSLTEKGKELAYKIEKIEEDWENLISSNIHEKNQEVSKILKSLVISSIKSIKSEKMENGWEDEDFFKFSHHHHFHKGFSPMKKNLFSRRF
ncbi:MarR family winged helix-turn-helix transcriptional regulator [Methanobrevibacter curvatus]|uniref:Transcriptional regulator SlyA n=1 Tax=Methanobrevibacter curvatus TaxID=49547 RepID=A0A166CI24_9EURY|nr:MarR family winged helix-turn-helix transcriptional regulator [Methanobrevibacter curvatus]KZX14529.1 transcriptional regulator SlyA [Methanobrevibacter curvatus]